MLERLNRSIKKRTNVAKIFANDESCLRLVSAIVTEVSEKWQSQGDYLAKRLSFLKNSCEFTERSLLNHNKNDYYLHYYPGKQGLKTLASWPDEYWHEFNEMVSYNTKDLGTKEALDSLSELYSIVKEKTYGMDEVFTDIIESDIPF